MDAIDLLEACLQKDIIQDYELRGTHIYIRQGRDRHVLSPKRAAAFARGVLRHADTLILLEERIAQQ